MMEKMTGESLDLTQENIKHLKELFPEVLTEKKIDFDKLRLILGDEVETSPERYEFRWNGKNEAIKLSQTPSMGTLRPDKESSENWDTTENLYIEGDNLEVLKLLQKSYFGKIKMIYIDPPYNTGKDFVYKDNFHDNIANYKEMTNQSTKANLETNGRFHTDWLNMMYPRLRLARNLLKEDGMMCISIDDNELTNLKKVCDEIFGESNFVVQITWTNKEGGGGSDSKYFKIKHEYILIYAKNINKLQINGIDVQDQDRYRYSDKYENVRGRYQLVKLNSASIQYSSPLDYPIEAPDGTLIHPQMGEKRACWRWSKEKFNWGIDNEFIVIKKDTNNVWQVYTKQYLNVDNNNNPINRQNRPIGIIDEFSSTQASKQLQILFGFKTFDYSKPLGLVKFLLERINLENEIVLDFFSGSATTAHAVMEISKELNKNIKYILVQLPELIEKPNSNYLNICEIGKDRIRKAAENILKSACDQSLDTGFKVYRLDDSNIKTWDPNTRDLENTLFNSVQNLKEDRTQEDLLYELMLKMGIELTAKIEEVNFDGKIIYNIQSGGLVICLEDEITKEVINYIPTLKSPFMDMKVVFKEYGFKSDADKMNAIQNLKQHGIKDVRSV